MSGRLPCEAEILEAIAWRIAGFPSEWVCEAAGSVFAGAVVADGSRIEESALVELAEGFQLRGDRRGGWSLACALLASEAHRRQAWPVFWPAGFMVWQARGQARRGRHKREPDALNRLISEYLAHQPDATAREIFLHFADLVTGWHSVLADFDGVALGCVLEPGKDLTYIGFHAFEQRLSKIRAAKHSPQPVVLRAAA